MGEAPEQPRHVVEYTCGCAWWYETGQVKATCELHVDEPLDPPARENRPPLSKARGRKA